MQQRPRRLLEIFTAVLWLLLACVSSARAGNCNVAIMGQGTKYVRSTLRILQRCELGVREGRIQAQQCRSEQNASRRIAKAAAKFHQRLHVRCAGWTIPEIAPLPPECQGVSTLDELIDCLLGLLDGHVDNILASEFGCPGRCGDGIADTECGEQCDGTDLAGNTCFNLGFSGGGTLLCSQGCAFYTGNCVP